MCDCMGAGVIVKSMGTQVVLYVIPPLRGKRMGGWLDEVDETSFFRQLKEASHPQVLVFTGN